MLEFQIVSWASPVPNKISALVLGLVLLPKQGLLKQSFKVFVFT